MSGTIISCKEVLCVFLSRRPSPLLQVTKPRKPTLRTISAQQTATERGELFVHLKCARPFSENSSCTALLHISNSHLVWKVSGVKRTGPGFSVVPSAMTRGNGHKPEHRKLHVNLRKVFFTVRVTEDWSRLPTEAVESPLEIFKTC